MVGERVRFDAVMSDQPSMTSGIGVDDVTVMMTNVIAVRFCFTKMKELMKKKKEMRMKMKRSEDACSQLIQVSHLLKKLTIEQIKMMKLNRESFTNSLKQSNHHFVDLDSFINKIFRPGESLDATNALKDLYHQNQHPKNTLKFQNLNKFFEFRLYTRSKAVKLM